MPKFEKSMLKLFGLIPTLDPNACWPMAKTITTPRRDGPPQINSTRYLYTLLIGELTLTQSLERRPGCHPECQNPYHRVLGSRGLTSITRLKTLRGKRRYVEALMAEAKDLARNIRELREDAPTMTRSEMFDWFSTQDPNFIGLTIEEFNQTIFDNPDLAMSLS